MSAAHRPSYDPLQALSRANPAPAAHLPDGRSPQAQALLALLLSPSRAAVAGTNGSGTSSVGRPRRRERAGAAANPVRDERLLAVGGRSEALRSRIVATQRDAISTPPQAGGRSSRPRLVALVLVCTLAIAVPTVAVATHFGLLDLSNAGKPIDTSKLSLDQTGRWKRAAVQNDVRRLGERAGVVFYLARGHSANANVCFSYVLASGSDLPGSENAMSCPAGPDAFPSAKEPILDLSYPMPPPYPHNYPRDWSTLRRLVGVAADGVARVGYVDLEGVVHSTPVVDNLYATDTFGPDGVRATAIVALDSNGRTLYTFDLLR